ARLVVVDETFALAADEGRIGRAAQVDEEDLGRFGDAVAVDQDGDGLRGLAGGKRERSGRGLVVAACRGSPAGRGEVDRDGDVVGDRQADGEGEGGRARVPFLVIHGRGVDEEAWLLVHDGAHALAVGDDRVGRTTQVDGERLVRLIP